MLCGEMKSLSATEAWTSTQDRRHPPTRGPALADVVDLLEPRHADSDYPTFVAVTSPRSFLVGTFRRYEDSIDPCCTYHRLDGKSLPVIVTRRSASAGSPGWWIGESCVEVHASVADKLFDLAVKALHSVLRTVTHGVEQ